jgi:hypothetical protein
MKSTYKFLLILIFLMTMGIFTEGKSIAEWTFVLVLYAVVAWGIVYIIEMK